MMLIYLSVLKNMKYSSFIIFIALLLFCSFLKAEKLPTDIPEPTDGEILFATIADDYDLKKYYPELTENKLEEIDGYSVIDQKKIPHSVKTLEAINKFRSITLENGPLGLCFEPRHYISYASAYGKVDLLICFECSRVFVTLEGWGKTFSVNKAGATQLNQFYTSIGLTLPKLYQEKFIENEHSQ